MSLHGKKLLAVLTPLELGSLAGLWGWTAQRESGAALAVLGLAVAFVGNMVLHECAHLVVARSVRLPVVGVRVLGKSFGKYRRNTSMRQRALTHAVFVDLTRASSLLLAPRMVLFALAGPVSNAAAAGVAYALTTQPHFPSALRCALFGATVAGAYIALGNLIPVSLSDGNRNDGLVALRWLTAPGRRRDELTMRRAQNALAVPGSGVSVDWERLRSATDDPRPNIAGQAAVRLLLAIIRMPDARLGEMLDVETPRLARLAHSPGLDPGTCAWLASTLAYRRAIVYLRDLGASQTDPVSAEARTIVELAELGHAAAPDDVYSLASLGLARLIQDRPAETRALLVGARLGSAPVSIQAIAYVIRAFAEIELGDLAQARRVLEAARRADPGAPLMKMAQASLTRAQSAVPEVAPP